MPLNILQYESDIWSSADSLRSAGLKQSDFPKYMMPFFALRMVESRLIREHKRLTEEFGKSENNTDDYIEYFMTAGLGYNDYVIRNNKTLSDICANDKTFESDFKTYLGAFDEETRHLLGVDKGNDEEKYLDISGVCGILRAKKILFSIVQGWSKIDLEPYDNSEITTLEEHIKRKWADISAETAGEQYTPDDIIALISDIVATKIQDNEEFLTLYDITCGGGNLLFGVEDKLNKVTNRPIKTHGMDWNSSLYALAKIESRFRIDSDIKYGNTLTDTAFIDKTFDVIVSNPPYGVDWKDSRKAIETDKTGRFVALPAISDGQLLFDQHIVYHLDNDGIAVVVNNGSSLFSGDAGSGESTIRKYFFDKDWVEAIIQMPTDEFFNTGIYTYLWVFNKNKPTERKDKIILIDGSSKYVPLKKSKGKKRREMSEENRADIINALAGFEDNYFAKVFDKWHFYFNKQSIMLTNVDSEGKFIEEKIKLKPELITQVNEDGIITLNTFELSDFDKSKYNSIVDCYNDTIAPAIAGFDYKEFQLTVKTTNKLYTYLKDDETIIEVKSEDDISNLNGKRLGCGKIQIKSTFKKATKTADAKYSISVELVPDLQKDYEIIAYSPNEDENKANIAAFMAKYVTRPFVYLDNTIGVEINFNKVFYEAELFENSNSLVSDYEKLNNAINKNNLQQSIIEQYIKESINKGFKVKNTGIEFIGDIPEHWQIKRVKDVFKYTTGGTPDTKNESYYEGENVWICISDITESKFVSDSKTKISDKAIKDSNMTKTPKGSLLYSFKLSIGKMAFVESNVYTNEAILSIFPNSKISLEFIYYMLPYYLNIAATENIYGAKMLNQKLIANAFIPIPPLNEQIAIATYLNEKSNQIDAMLSNIGEQINKLTQLRKTLINDVVTGKIKLTEN